VASRELQRRATWKDPAPAGNLITNQHLSIIWGVLGSFGDLVGQGRITPFTCPLMN
jgi:hypothetical protein